MSDFELKFFAALDFEIQSFFFSNVKIELIPTTCTFLIVFLHTPMKKNCVHYLRQLDNNIRHCSNSTSCYHFRKDFDFWFQYDV